MAQGPTPMSASAKNEIVQAFKSALTAKTARVRLRLSQPCLQGLAIPHSAIAEARKLVSGPLEDIRTRMALASEDGNSVPFAEDPEDVIISASFPIAPAGQSTKTGFEGGRDTSLLVPPNPPPALRPGERWSTSSPETFTQAQRAHQHQADEAEIFRLVNVSTNAIGNLSTLKPMAKEEFFRRLAALYGVNFSAKNSHTNPQHVDNTQSQKSHDSKSHPKQKENSPKVKGPQQKASKAQNTLPPLAKQVDKHVRNLRDASAKATDPEMKSSYGRAVNDFIVLKKLIVSGTVKALPENFQSIQTSERFGTIMSQEILGQIRSFRENETKGSPK